MAHPASTGQVALNKLTIPGGGEELTIYFSHMTVKLVGKGLDVLADGLRRQVIPYIQERHVSDFEAKQEAHGVESIKIEPPAEEGVLGKWVG